MISGTNLPRKRKINRAVLRAIVALLAVAIVGLLWYNLSPTGILQIPPVTEPAPTNRSSGAGLHVSLREAKRAFDNEAALFIDARSSREYASGHIPGALNVPPSDFSGNEALDRLRSDQPVIAYCAGERCQSSIVLAEMLIGVRGHINTRVFFGGWDAWKAADYPVATGNRP